jgi:hypothetical protein
MGGTEATPKTKERKMENKLLQDLVNVAGKHARLVLVEFKMGQLVPSWLILRGDGQVEIFGTPWKNDSEKEHTANMIRKKLKETQAQAYSLVTEAWTAKWEKGTAKQVRPSDRADRQEVVIALATDGKETVYRRWLMRRDAKGKLLDLEVDDVPMIGAVSWMESLFIEPSSN